MIAVGQKINLRMINAIVIPTHAWPVKTWYTITGPRGSYHQVTRCHKEKAWLQGFKPERLEKNDSSQLNSKSLDLLSHIHHFCMFLFLSPNKWNMFRLLQICDCADSWSVPSILWSDNNVRHGSKQTRGCGLDKMCWFLKAWQLSTPMFSVGLASEACNS